MQVVLMALMFGLVLVGCDRAPDEASTVVIPAEAPVTSVPMTAPSATDVAMAAAVEAELGAEPTLRELPLRVTARNGIVVLEGQVDSIQTAQHVGVIAAAVDGVIEVDNRLAVRDAR